MFRPMLKNTAHFLKWMTLAAFGLSGWLIVDILGTLMKLLVLFPKLWTQMGSFQSVDDDGHACVKGHTIELLKRSKAMRNLHTYLKQQRYYKLPTSSSSLRIESSWIRFILGKHSPKFFNISNRLNFCQNCKVRARHLSISLNICT